MRLTAEGEVRIMHPAPPSRPRERKRMPYQIWRTATQVMVRAGGGEILLDADEAAALGHELAPPQPVTRKHYRLTPGEIDEIRRRYLAGEKVKTIAAALGMGHSTVSWYVA